MRVSVRGDKGQRSNTVESSKHPGTKGAIVYNKRCEITVALYGDTSDCSSIPDEAEPVSPQYFVEAYAVRDAFLKEECWLFPMLLRFEEFDVSVTYNVESDSLCCSRCMGDFFTTAVPCATDGVAQNDPHCLYWNRIDSLRPFAGEIVISISPLRKAVSQIVLKLGNGAIVTVASRKLHFRSVYKELHADRETGC